MLHKYLAAAPDDQFLAGQDPHEAAAPTGGLLPNSEHRIAELAVTTDHRVAIFVPEPVFIAVDIGHGYKTVAPRQKPRSGRHRQLAHRIAVASRSAGVRASLQSRAVTWRRTKRASLIPAAAA
jgi:anti-sigma-K factor RskA